MSWYKAISVLYKRLIDAINNNKPAIIDSTYAKFPHFYVKNDFTYVKSNESMKKYIFVLYSYTILYVIESPSIHIFSFYK